MATGKAVAETAPSAVPALAHRPALMIESEDVALPRLYTGQFTSQAVKDQLVKPGCLYAATGPDDPDPTVYAESKGKDGVPQDDGVEVYILGMTKGWSYAEKGEELESWRYDDPSRHPDAWVTYQYTVAIPAFDIQVPHKWLLTKSNKPTAKQINTVLVKNAETGPPWATPFKVFTRYRSNTQGEWYVVQAVPCEPTPEYSAVAEQLAVMVGGANQADLRSTGEEPAI